jgi:hypothetical protein
MKLGQICKYTGYISGGIGALLMLGGIIGFFAGPFLSVAKYWNFFWGAQFFFVAAIFFMLVHFSCNTREEKS